MNTQVMNRVMIILAGTVLVATLMMITASNVNADDSDFKIKKFGIDQNGDPFLTVEGTAGGTKPTEAGHIFAYVFFTDDGIYAVTSHPGIEDSSEVKDDSNWHAHKVKLSNDNPPCVTSLKEKGDALLHGNKVSVENIDQATKVDKVLTADLVAKNNQVCVDHVFDSKP
jgi:hypothetical protein